MKYISGLLMVGILISCSQKKKEINTETQDTEEQPIVVLDMEKGIRQTEVKELTWNDFAKSVRFVPLETSGHHLLSPYLSIYKADDEILLTDNQQSIVGLFDSQGKRKMWIKKEGNGPGEYNYLTYVCKNKQTGGVDVFDNGINKIIHYDLQGKLLNEVSTKEKDLHTMRMIGNELYVTTNLPVGNIKNAIRIYNDKMELQTEAIPYDTTLTGREIMIYMRPLIYTSLDSSVYYGNYVRDTIYEINKKGIFPRAVLNMGAYKLPRSEYSQMMTLLNKTVPYVLLPRMSVWPGYYFVQYVYNGSSWAQMWDRKTGELVGRRQLIEPGGKDFKSIPYTLESGKIIYTTPIATIGKELIFVLSAEDVAGVVPGVKEDDNPVLMFMRIQ